MVELPKEVDGSRVSPSKTKFDGRVFTAERGMVTKPVELVDLGGRSLDGGTGAGRRELSVVGVRDFVDDCLAEVVG